jgi:hypothetical protein
MNLENKMDDRTKLAIDLGQTIYNNTIRDLQAKVETQAKELEALRGFAEQLEGYDWSRKDMTDVYKLYGLIDESGNPTKLLTGDK